MFCHVTIGNVRHGLLVQCVASDIAASQLACHTSCRNPCSVLCSVVTTFLWTFWAPGHSAFPLCGDDAREKHKFYWTTPLYCVYGAVSNWVLVHNSATRRSLREVNVFLEQHSRVTRQQSVEWLKGVKTLTIINQSKHATDPSHLFFSYICCNPRILPCTTHCPVASVFGLSDIPNSCK